MLLASSCDHSLRIDRFGRFLNLFCVRVRYFKNELAISISKEHFEDVSEFEE